MNWLKKYFYLLPVLLFIPALGNFFASDDWFHLRITQISSLNQFLNFFSFTPNAQTASFYRPISTQVFFFVFQKLFGLTAWPYYLFGLLFFAYSLYLVKKLSQLYLPHLPSTSPQKLRLKRCWRAIHNLPPIIYGVSVSNFTRIYFLSAYQELFLVVFSLLTILNFKKKPFLSLLFFILALLSKETAIILPALILLLNFKSIKIRQHFYLFTCYLLLSLVYLYFRLTVFGLAQGDSYLWSFSPVKILNTLMWYTLWSFGAPELLVDYVGSGLRLVPKFFIDYSSWWPVIIFPLVGTIVSAIALGLQKIKKLDNNLIKFSCFFLVTLLPVLFLPSHKFNLELGLPLVGFSLALASLISSRNNILNIAFLSFYIFLNLSMNYLTYTRHYSVSRSKISKTVYNYFKQRSVTPPTNYFFEFKNDATDNGQDWGQSKQISQALSGSNFFKVYYQNNAVEVFYEDLKSPRPADKQEIPLSTALFLN